MSYSTKVGDQQPVAVQAELVALPQSVVLAADVADKGSAINDACISAKQAGATIIYDDSGTLSLAIAQGGTATSTWVVVDGVNTVVTPA